jgi:hypothetical protein
MGSGKNALVAHQRFRYIVIPHLSFASDSLIADRVSWLEEYRTNLKGAPAGSFSLDKLYMLTEGFVSTWLYVSSADQMDSHFRYVGTQTIRKRECQVVAFAQDPVRAHRIQEVHVAGAPPAHLLLQGLAWIDAETHQTLRMMTWLLAPRPDLHLDAQNSTVDFYPVQPAGSDRTLWLPREVTVWVVYHGVPIRNIHHYSDFELFRVESTIKAGP